ncbi:MAG: YihY/virulence factor BrkB family protein [Calditrichia bacterium]|nr:YihY/virulence factor BrkB family protein [Calditrichota bacterium]MCB9067758.1 YihY/virulence factor BrkB family protein [Calditrichia bacterium]
MKIIRALWKLLKLTALKWEDDNIAWMSAALAYYTLFSLAPTFIILVVIGGKFFGEEAVKGQIVYYLEDLIGHNSALVIQNMIEAGESLATLSFGNIIGVLLVLYAATNVFFQLKNTLNEIWEIPNGQRHWVVSMLLNRILSVVMVLSIGILLLGSVLIDITLAVFDEILTEFMPMFDHVSIWKAANLGISFVLNGILFSVIYKYLPDAKVKWQDVWLGAAIASFLFTASKFLIALYLGNSQIISLFGAASSFVAILVWVYFSAQLLLLGASFTHFYAYEYGSHVGEPYTGKLAMNGTNREIGQSSTKEQD